MRELHPCKKNKKSEGENREYDGETSQSKEIKVIFFFFL